MFEVESVPSRDNASYLLLLLSRYNVKDERYGAKSAVSNATI